MKMAFIFLSLILCSTVVYTSGNCCANVNRKLDSVIGMIESLRADIYSGVGRLEDAVCPSGDEEERKRNYLALSERILMARDQILDVLEVMGDSSSGKDTLLDQVKEIKAEGIVSREEILASLELTRQTLWTFQDRLLALLAR